MEKAASPGPQSGLTPLCLSFLFLGKIGSISALVRPGMVLPGGRAPQEEGLLSRVDLKNLGVYQG